MSSDLALIQTLDFYACGDDPYDFGQIAAADTLSDVCHGWNSEDGFEYWRFPKMDVEILGDFCVVVRIKVMEAGAVLAGGHTIQDDTPKYGA